MPYSRKYISHCNFHSFNDGPIKSGCKCHYKEEPLCCGSEIIYCVGPQGPQGEPGGSTSGSEGPQGPQGIQGISTATGASFNANTNTQTNVVPFTPISFPITTVDDPSKTIIHSTDTAFTVTQTGRYTVTFNITGIGGPLLGVAIAINGIMYNSTITTTQPPPELISSFTGTFILDLIEDNVISLIATEPFVLALTSKGTRSLIIQYLGIIDQNS